MILLKDSKKKIVSKTDAIKVFQELLNLEDAIDQDKEHFYVMHLDARNKVKMVECVSIGIINASMTHPREIYRRAIIEGTATILVAHNHPSNEVEPSDADIATTRRLVDAGNVIGISLLDHIIFSKEKGYSFKESGEL